jgi:hypothetical protein
VPVLATLDVVCGLLQRVFWIGDRRLQKPVFCEGLFASADEPQLSTVGPMLAARLDPMLAHLPGILVVNQIPKLFINLARFLSGIRLRSL